MRKMFVVVESIHNNSVTVEALPTSFIKHIDGKQVLFYPKQGKNIAKYIKKQKVPDEKNSNNWYTIPDFKIISEEFENYSDARQKENKCAIYSCTESEIEHEKIKLLKRKHAGNSALQENYLNFNSFDVNVPKKKKHAVSTLTSAQKKLAYTIENIVPISKSVSEATTISEELSNDIVAGSLTSEDLKEIDRFHTIYIQSIDKDSAIKYGPLSEPHGTITDPLGTHSPHGTIIDPLEPAIKPSGKKTENLGSVIEPHGTLIERVEISDSTMDVNLYSDLMPEVESTRLVQRCEFIRKIKNVGTATKRQHEVPSVAQKVLHLRSVSTYQGESSTKHCSEMSSTSIREPATEDLDELDLGIMPFETTNQDMKKEIQLLNSKVEALTSHLSDIKKQNIEIIKFLHEFKTESLRHQRTNTKKDPSFIPPALPIITVQDLLVFDGNLKKEEYKDQMIIYFKEMRGLINENIRESIKRCLQKIVNYNVLVQYSWSGKSSFESSEKTKLEFIALNNLINFLRELFPATVTADVDNEIKYFMKRVPQKYKRLKQKLNKSTM